MKNKKYQTMRVIKRAIVVLAVLIIGMMYLMPIFWIFSTSLRVPKDSFTLPPHFFPTEFIWSNYMKVFSLLPFWSFTKNSLIVVCAGTLLQIIISSLAAFAFARIEFPGKNILFVMFLAGIMIPGQVTIIPKFLMLRQLNLLNTLYSLILPAAIDPLAIFLLRQNMMTVPRSYDEAAYIDGASKLRVYWNVVMPMCRSSIVVVVVTRALVLWNDFFHPLIFISEYKYMTLPLGLTALKSAATFGDGSIAYVMAGISMASVPPLLLYIFCQKQLMSSSALSGLKS